MTDNPESTKILNLIETVSPDDEATLDEIDARVACYVDGDREYIGLYKDDITTRQFVYKSKGKEYCDPIYVYGYTRSLDAIKAIEPEGWSLTLYFDEQNWRCDIIKWIEYTEEHQATSPYLPTEYLGRLHAVIQAIAYEREHTMTKHDMPRTIWCKSWCDEVGYDVWEITYTAEPFQQLGHDTEYTRSDSGNVLPELPEGWRYSLIDFVKPKDIRCFISDGDYRCVGKGKNPHDAALNAIKNIGEINDRTN